MPKLAANPRAVRFCEFNAKLPAVIDCLCHMSQSVDGEQGARGMPRGGLLF